MSRNSVCNMRSKLLLGLGLLLSFAIHAQPMAELPFTPVAVGSGTLRYLGFKIYDGSLWTATGRWQPDAPYALELVYARNFDGDDIARRSVQEIAAQRDVNDATLARWESQMRALFPDVREGSRLTGLRVPGQGVIYFDGSRRIGSIADEAFADAFFDIWLGPKTSAPKMRKKLLGLP